MKSLMITILREKWGDTLRAVVVLHEGQNATAEEISGYGKGRIASFKIPQNVVFIKDEEMPRTGNGKILHRVLRERHGMWKGHQEQCLRLH